MSSEALVWEHLTRSRPADILGYLPGATDQGLLAVSDRRNGATSGQLNYRAFLPHNGGLRSAEVCGVELILDVDRVRRVEGVRADAGGVEALVVSVLSPEVALLGSLPSSDSASLLVTRTTESDALQLWVAWWEAANSLVLLPAQGRVPAAALIPVVTSDGTDAPPLKKLAAGDKRRSPLGMRVTLAMVAAGVVAVATWAVVAQRGAMTDFAKADSVGVVTNPVTPAASQTHDTAPPSSSPVKVDSSVAPPILKGPAQKTATAKAGTQARRGDSAPAITTPPKEVRRRDLASDKEELRTLVDQSLDAEERSTTQWQDLGARGERLFERLNEGENRSEAARVILRLYGNGGGNARACRYLDDIQGLGAVERRLFGQRNRCP